MKKLHKFFLAIALLIISNPLPAQDAELPEPSINLRYFNINGHMQYLKAKALVRENNKLQPVPGLKVAVYLDEEAEENLVGNFITDEKGEFKAAVPAQLKPKWMAATTHNFLAVSAATKRYAAGSGEVEIAKARFVIDTLNEDGTRQVSAQLLAFADSAWTPVGEADVKLAVRRLGGDLNISEESYTTDESGMVTGEFSMENLPAVDKGRNIILVAKTEDHEQFGNVIFEKSVPWGIYQQAETNFGTRSLWASRDKAPVWLLLLANFILLSVWGVLFYLVVQIIKMKKAGREVPPPSGSIFQHRAEKAEIHQP